MAPPSRSSDISAQELGAGPIIRRLLHDYVAGKWGILILGVLCMLLASAMGVAIPWLCSTLVKQVFLRKTASLLLPLSLMAFGIMILRAAGTFFGRMLVDSLGERAVASAQRDMFEQLIKRDLADLNAVHSGQFISNFLYDATLMRDAITQSIAAIFLELVQLLGYVGYAMVSDWQLGLLAMLTLPGVAWAMERLGGSMRKAAGRSMSETGDLSVVLSEAMDGRRVIKAYGLENQTAARVAQRLATRLKTLLRAVRLRAAAAPLTDIFAGAAIALVIFVAGWQILQGDLTFNTFTGFIVALLLAQQPVRNLSQLWPVVSSGVAAANRMFDSIDVRPAIVSKPGAKKFKVLPGGGAVRFRAASFSYAGAEAPTLDAVDIDIPAGKRIALVGPSGAGKTTIFNLLLRFYDPVSGGIEIDGQNIHDVTIDSLRAAIAVVTQEAILFDESIAANIALGRQGATRTEIEAAARNAAAHDFIALLPEGYDTRVGEGGLKLSGGQRQRIAIARAMLRDAPILLLDEATSALDSESERQVQESLNRLMAGRTTIVIAHRLSTVRDADCIFVIARGRIVESGTHAALIEKSGLYAQLYSHNLADAEPV